MRVKRPSTEREKIFAPEVVWRETPIRITRRTPTKHCGRDRQRNGGADSTWANISQRETSMWPTQPRLVPYFLSHQGRTSKHTDPPGWLRNRQERGGGEHGEQSEPFHAVVTVKNQLQPLGPTKKPRPVSITQHIFTKRQMLEASSSLPLMASPGNCPDARQQWDEWTVVYPHSDKPT